MTTSASTTSITTVDGIELGDQVVGDVAPVVLLHGGFGSAGMFGPNIPLLAEHRWVVAVDLQSHGRCPAADRSMRFESMADDIAALIDELGLERAAIIGFLARRRRRPPQRDPALGDRRARRPCLNAFRAAGLVSRDDRRHGRERP